MVTKRPKTPKTEEVLPVPTMLQHLGIEKTPEAEGTGAKDTAADAMKALQDQLADMRGRMDELQRANLALLTAAPTVNTQPEVKNDGKVDLKGLPDPTLDPEGYSIGLNQRVNAAISGAIASFQTTQSSQNDLNERLNRLQSDFEGRFPDYFGDKAKLEYIATQVATDAKRRGIDVNKYMFSTPDQYMRDVVSAYDKSFGKPSDGEAEETEEQRRAPPHRAAPKADDEDNGRTAGIFGGQESGGRPAPGGQPQAGDMVKDLQDMQRKSGFF